MANSVAADWFIGVDIGTSGCRAIALDAQGGIAASARSTLPASSRPQPGWSEQQPADWWNAFTAVMHTLLRSGSGRPRSLCLDATSSTLLLADAGGQPLTPGLMYDDRRASAAADQIAHHAPTQSPARGAGSALSKLLYLLGPTGRPDAAYALHQADWLSGRLTGHFGVSDENNVLKLGYDPVIGHWPDWLEAFTAVRPLLPKVVPVGTPLGVIEPSLAATLGLPADLMVVAGTTDSNAATLAAGDHESGDAVTSLGSTLVVKVWSERPVNAAQFGVYSHRLNDRWLAGGASNSGGAVLRQHFSDAELADLSATLDPHRSTGLDYYPLPATGERFPVNDPDLQPRLAPVPADRAVFLQGMLEGIARIEADGYRRLAELGAPFPSRVFTAGGGAANPAWSAIRQRLLGVPVMTATHGEAAYGVASLARAAWQSA